MNENPMKRYIGTTVITKEPIPSDRRGLDIPAGTPLIVSGLVGTKHCTLEFGDGKRAANQVPFSKLMTG
jgi:hypothetical protein